MCVKAKLDMPHPKPISSHYGSIFREQETIATVLIHLYSVWRKVLFNQGGIYIYAKFKHSANGAKFPNLLPAFYLILL